MLVNILIVLTRPLFLPHVPPNQVNHNEIDVIRKWASAKHLQ